MCSGICWWVEAAGLLVCVGCWSFHCVHKMTVGSEEEDNKLVSIYHTEKKRIVEEESTALFCFQSLCRVDA